MDAEVLARARRIRLLTCDVDGVLTDGRIYVDDDGREFKAYSALDGQGIKMLQRAGIEVAWITGSDAPSVAVKPRLRCTLGEFQQVVNPFAARQQGGGSTVHLD